MSVGAAVGGADAGVFAHRRVAYGCAPTVVGSALGTRRSGAVISNLLPGQEAGSGLQTGCGKSWNHGKITIN